MYTHIETERLSIRPILVDDYQFMYQLMNSEGWLRYIGNRNIKDENDAKKYIQQILDNNEYFYHVVVLKSTSVPIGLVTFLKRTLQEFPDFGFAFLPEFQKKGYAYEASREYLNYLVLNSSHPRIIAITLEENVASIQLLNRLGFNWSMNKIENKQTVSYFVQKTSQQIDS